jgi:hypothetical protein
MYNFDVQPIQFADAFKTLRQNKDKANVQRLTEAYLAGDVNAIEELAAVDRKAAAEVMALQEGMAPKKPKALDTKLLSGQMEVLGSALKANPEFAAPIFENMISLYGDHPQIQANLSELYQGFNSDPQGALDEMVNISKSLREPEKGKEKAPYQKAEGGMVFDPNTGTYSIDPVGLKRYEQMAQKAISNGELDFKDRQSLNKDVTAIVKESIGIKSAASELDQLKSRGTAAARLGAVFKFMKALDPTSVVRETEQGQVYSAQGAGSEIAGLINGLMGKGKLTDEGFQDLVDTAKVIANSNISSTSTQVIGLLDTFGDTIPVTFKQKVAERVPVLFKVSAPITQTKSLDSMTVEELKALKAGM